MLSTLNERFLQRTKLAKNLKYTNYFCPKKVDIIIAKPDISACYYVYTFLVHCRTLMYKVHILIFWLVLQI